MKCDACGYTFDGIPSLPSCPFCRQSFSASKEAIEALSAAEAAVAEKRLGTATEWYKTAANSESARGASLYANAKEKGIGCKKNTVEAVKFHSFAAERGEAASATALGRILLRDYGDRKKDEAMFWFLVAAESGDATASYYLALECPDDEKLYLFTVAALGGVTAAAREAAKWLDAQKEHDAALIKGFLRLAGRDAFRVPLLHLKYIAAEPKTPVIPARDEAAAFYRVAKEALARHMDYLAVSFFGRAAALGCGAAATHIGNLFASGRSVPKSMTNAGKWYLRATELGDVGAMVSLGEMLLHGNGIERDPEKALALFRRCASLGDAKAEFLAAELYFDGNDIKRDLPLALELYGRSADKGFPPALAKKEEIGAAVAETFHRANDAFKEKDHIKAFRLFTLAAEMGHGGAIANLAACYQHGFGCKKDMKKALALYRRAVVFGKASAKYSLGLCYLRNDGVRFNAARAEELLLGSGYPDAASLVEALRQKKKLKKGQRLYSLATVLYRKGDDVGALRARTLAASLGVKSAMCMIGCHYEFGVAAPRSMDTARRFYLESGLPLNKIDRLKRGFLKSIVAQGKR